MDWIAWLMFGGLIALALRLGMKTAALRFAERDALRYSWLRRQQWIRDGLKRMDACDVDRMCDVGRIAEKLTPTAQQEPKP